MGVGTQVLGEAPDIQVQQLGSGDEVRRLQAMLVRIERFVHLPEPSLAARRLGGFRCEGGVRVDRRERELAVGEPEIAAEPIDDLFRDRMRPCAERALVVAVLHHREGRIVPASDVVALR